MASDPSSTGAPDVRVICGDMRAVLRALPAESVHAIVTDPPYGFAFMGKQWDQQVPGPEYWRECLRVAKPGAYMVAFGGPRTAHRLACAIEDAGWEIRDCLSWLFGSGFPKSHDVSKAIDREAGAVREVVGTRDTAKGTAGTGHDFLTPGSRAAVVDVTAPATDAARAWDGWGTALKPAWEPIYLARKPFKGSVAHCVCEHGCGALNIDGCRIGTTVETWPRSRSYRPGSFQPTHDGSDPTQCTGSAPLGRWPANLVLDEAAAAMLDAQTGELSSYDTTGSWGQNRHGVTTIGAGMAGQWSPGRGDKGGASRFYFTASHSEAERWNGLANCAGHSFNLGSDASVFALVDAVARATGGWVLSRASYRAPSTTVTASEFGKLCESVTTLTQCIAQRFSLGLPLQSMSLANDHAKCAAMPEPTGTTTITASLSTSDGSVVDVIFSITPPSAEAGVLDSARFKYTAKASRTEREAGLDRCTPRNVNDGRDSSIDNPYQRGDTERRNTHPTVKPIALMRWLVRLITPPGATVLDPFTGSGSTGVAAVLEGAHFIGCELSPEYAELARARIAHAADEDDGPQLTLFERDEVARPRPTQASFLWSDDERDK